MVINMTFIETIAKMIALLILIMIFMGLLSGWISIFGESQIHSLVEKEKKKMEKKRIKTAKKNRKNLVKRIKNMTPEQFDAYYETLVEIYGRECFHKEFAKRYVKRLKGVLEETRDEKDLAVVKKKSCR